MATQKRAANRRNNTAKKAIQGKRNQKPQKSDPNTATRHNRAAYWKAYRELQAKADKAWEKFRNDVKKNVSSDVLIRDHNHLRLLLGECNYMARECMRIATKGKMKAPKNTQKPRRNK